MFESVLVIYNCFQGDVERTHFWQESEESILDEVNAVTASLGKLGIAFRQEPVRNLEHLGIILQRSRQRLVFNLVEEFPNCIHDACLVPAICRANGRAFTGSDTPALLLAQNKWQTKAVLKAANIPCPDGVLIPVAKSIPAPQLTAGKYIVKPLFSDASEGIDTESIIEIPGRSFRKRVERIHSQLGQPALVEQFIPDRELNVSVLQYKDKMQVIAIAEIDFSKFDAGQPRIVDYSAKWLPDTFAYNNTPRILPAKISAETARLVEKYSLDACRLIDCRGYIRVDFRLDEKENPYILEINPNPDISPDAGFAAALNYRGISYEKFVEFMLENAILNKTKPHSQVVKRVNRTSSESVKAAAEDRPTEGENIAYQL
jgi:D-alanine-D-alanine ligase